MNNWKFGNCIMVNAIAGNKNLLLVFNFFVVVAQDKISLLQIYCMMAKFMFDFMFPFDIPL